MSERPISVFGAVLTGGHSRRFGSPKALAHVDGVPMAVRVARALSSAGCDPVVAVGSVQGLAEVWNVDVGTAALAFGPILEDLWPGEGPLAGVLSAMAHCGGDVVTAACDLAWLDEFTVRSVLEIVLRSTQARTESVNDHGVIPDAAYGVCDGRMVPVVWWSERSRPVLEAAFGAGERSLHGALGLLDVRHVTVTAHAARGVNKPEDLDARGKDF